MTQSNTSNERHIQPCRPLSHTLSDPQLETEEHKLLDANSKTCPPQLEDWLSDQSHYLTSTLQRGSTIGERFGMARAKVHQCLAETRHLVATVISKPPFSLDNEADATLPICSSIDPLEEANILLDVHLARFKAMVFNGHNSTKLAVSGGRLNRVSRRLRDAVESFTTVISPIREVSCKLKARFPGHHDTQYERASAALLILKEWDAASLTDISPELASSILASLARNDKIRLALFVCPPVDFQSLRGTSPHQYLSTDMRRSVLSRQVERLRDLFRSLHAGGLEIELLAFIADTDEEDYLWHGIPRPRNLDLVLLEQTRISLVSSVKTYLADAINRSHTCSRILREEAIRVFRLSAIPISARVEVVRTSVASAPHLYFDETDLTAEMAIMRRLWKPGSYYDGLDEPVDLMLRHIIVQKFAAYAKQGVLLWEFDPTLVLIQTERPSALRIKMLNAGRNALCLPNLGAAQFFGS